MKKILIIIGILLICIIASDAIIQSQKKIVLQGFFTNDNRNLFPAKETEIDFVSYLKEKGISYTKKDKVSFEDSLFLELGSHKDYTTASLSKVMAYTAAKELDFIITTKEMTEHFVTGFALSDFEDLLPKELYNELKPYIHTYKDNTGKEKACSLSFSNSKFVKNSGFDDIPEYFMICPQNSSRKELVVQFIEFSFKK